MKRTLKDALALMRIIPDGVRYEEIQLLWLWETLRRCRWNKTVASEKLGICLRTIRNNKKYMEGLGLYVPRAEVTAKRPPKRFKFLP